MAASGFNLGYSRLRPTILVAGGLAMLLDSIFGSQGWAFFTAAGVVFGVALEWSATRQPREALNEHLWLVPFVAFIVFFLLRMPELAVTAFVCLVVVRAATYWRIRTRHGREERPNQ